MVDSCLPGSTIFCCCFTWSCVLSSVVLYSYCSQTKLDVSLFIWYLSTISEWRCWINGKYWCRTATNHVDNISRNSGRSVSLVMHLSGPCTDAISKFWKLFSQLIPQMSSAGFENRRGLVVRGNFSDGNVACRLSLIRGLDFDKKRFLIESDPMLI